MPHRCSREEGAWLVLSSRQAAYIAGGSDAWEAEFRAKTAVSTKCGLRLQPADSEQGGPNESSSSPKSVSTNRTCGENISGCNSTTFLLLFQFFFLQWSSVEWTLEVWSYSPPQLRVRSTLFFTDLTVRTLLLIVYYFGGVFSFVFVFVFLEDQFTSFSN